MEQSDLVQRLAVAHPGWPEWEQLIELVHSLSMSLVEHEYLGTFLTARRTDLKEPGNDDHLTFAVPGDEQVWPEWLPAYAVALVGLKAEHYEMAGGYADAFTGEPTRSGYLFMEGVPDDQLGYPAVPVPPNCYPFQYSHEGTLFHITAALEVVHPDEQQLQFVTLDALEAFTRKNIQQALLGRRWLEAYDHLEG